MALLTAVGVHETAHVICARLFGWERPRLCVEGCGLRLIYSVKAEFISSLFVALSGSLAGGILYLFRFLPCSFRLYSLGLATVNLLPVSGLDGGEVIGLVLDRFLLPHRAEGIKKLFSTVTVLALFFISTSVHLQGEGNPSLLFFSAYLLVSVLAS